MKKLFALIVTILGIGVSFCSADFLDFDKISEISIYSGQFSSLLFDVGGSITHYSLDSGLYCFVTNNLIFPGSSSRLTFSSNYVNSNSNSLYQYSLRGSIVDSSFYCFFLSNSSSVTLYVQNSSTSGQYYIFRLDDYYSCSDKSIDIYYNNGNSESITCDGVQAIQIDGLSTITSTNTFTPYYNISYIDEDNQSLIESYDHDILYLENGKFKKTYTGSNDRILTVQSENQSFSGYLPVFDVTGGIQDVSTSGNVFNNFAENSLTVLLSNVPSYIQYVIIILILLFILGFIKKIRRRR